MAKWRNLLCHAEPHLNTASPTCFKAADTQFHPLTCLCFPFRLEQPYFSANTQFFQALSHCSSLQRLCIISRSGTLQSDAVMSFMANCLEVIMCHMFMGESLTFCRNLQQSIVQR